MPVARGGASFAARRARPPPGSRRPPVLADPACPRDCGVAPDSPLAWGAAMASVSIPAGLGSRAGVSEERLAGEGRPSG